MVRAPALDARERPDTKASPGLPHRAGLLAAFDLARDEVGLRPQRRSTISPFSRQVGRGDRESCAASARASLSQNFRFNFQTAKSQELYTRHCEPTGRANARQMTGSAKQSTTRATVKMDCFVALLLAMTVKFRHDPAVPRRDAPELSCKIRSPRKQRAQGMPGARCARRWSNGPRDLPSKPRSLRRCWVARVARLALEGRRSSLTLMV